MMDLIDETPSGKLCVVYQKQSAVEAVDEITGDTQKIYNIDSVKVRYIIIYIYMNELHN